MEHCQLSGFGHLFGEGQAALNGLRFLSGNKARMIYGNFVFF